MTDKILTIAQWLAFFDAAYVANVHVGIHLDEIHYHAESALRQWTRERGFKLAEREYGTTGGKWINLEWNPEAHPVRSFIIYRIREVISIVMRRCPACNVDHAETEFSADGRCLACEERDLEDLYHGDERGPEPDSNATLGLSQDFTP